MDEQGLIAQGKEFCDQIRSGQSVGQIQLAMASQFVDRGVTDVQVVKDQGYILAIAVKSFCPEYLIQLNAP